MFFPLAPVSGSLKVICSDVVLSGRLVLLWAGVVELTTGEFFVVNCQVVFIFSNDTIPPSRLLNELLSNFTKYWVPYSNREGKVKVNVLFTNTPVVVACVIIAVAADDTL